jgi:UDP-N-acetylglucosamine 2-epimerase (non-hydrolysing)
MREVLDHQLDRILSSDVLARLSLEAGGYFVVSAHREENVDSPDRLKQLLSCLTAVRDQWGLPLLVSTHPRTRLRLEQLPAWLGIEGVSFHAPFGFHDYNSLQINAACALSDSGTISEESIMLGFPAITLRSAIERPEALDAGRIVTTDLDPRQVVAAVADAQGQRGGSVPAEYEVTDTSTRVVRFIMSTAFQHRSWSGLRDE